MDCANGFSSDGPCGVSFIGGGGKAWAVVGTTAGSVPALKGSAVNLIPRGAEHAALSLNYQTQLDISQFTITFGFVPNGQNVALVIQNSTNNPWGFNGKDFSSGAGCEAGFFQGYSQPEPPDHVFALELDSRSALSHSDAWNFTYSSTQIYKSDESKKEGRVNLGMGDFKVRPVSLFQASAPGSLPRALQRSQRMPPGLSPQPWQSGQVITLAVPLQSGQSVWHLNS